MYILYLNNLFNPLASCPHEYMAQVSLSQEPPYIVFLMLLYTSVFTCIICT